jgi:NTP pyrophosphatase (non-canonical NTP hydrolase)
MKKQAEKSLTLQRFKEKNTERCCGYFHRIADWSPTDWSNAVAGEVGELCNLTKKWRRRHGSTMESGMANTPEDEKLIKKMMDEVADAFTYLDLFSTRMGFTMEEAVIRKFNKVSRRVGAEDIRL